MVCLSMDDHFFSRRSIRLKGFDYSSAGFYFVTIGTKRGEGLFGEICFSSGVVGLSSLGRIVQENWEEISSRYSNVFTDEFVVMPDHVHGIIVISYDDVPIGNRAGARPALTITLNQVVGAFKSKCVVDWLKFLRDNDLDEVGKFWHRNYFEHIIRTDDALVRIRRYILDNPSRLSSEFNFELGVCL